MGHNISTWAITTPTDLPPPPPLPPSLRTENLPAPPDLPDPSELYGQLKQLGDLLNMPPEKLNKLRQTIELIEKMSPVERESMRIRLSQITQSTPQLTSEIQQMAARHPDIPKADLSQFWLAASDIERDSIREALEKTDADAKSSLLNDKVEAFVKKRDAVFESMRKSLEEKRKNLNKSTDSNP